jgi:biopolymer transport protein ExbB
MRRRDSTWIGIGAVLCVVPLAFAQAPSDAPTSAESTVVEASSLLDLLDQVKRGLDVESQANLDREQAFLRARDDQARLLSEAQARLAKKEQLSHEYEETFNANEALIGEREARLTEGLGQMGEVFGVVRQVATDASGQLWDSLTSSQVEPRKELLDRLGRSKELPSTNDLQNLWYELQREMTLQGQVVRYTADVLTMQGQVERRRVIRAGPFSVVSDGRYLQWEAGQEKLRELGRQPPSRYVGTVAPFEATQSGFGVLAVDPTRGSLLTALGDTPTAEERVQQGGYVGYVIIVLGILGLVIGMIRWISISITSRRVGAQQRAERASEGNPLGRVMGVYERNRGIDVETLELKLNEVVLRESSRLERFLWIVKTVSVVAPLLGLLGTVTGMIKTFQAITLYGAGDPKMMASGISEALVTTMLGLIVAIPLVMLYDALANSSRRITNVLDEQSAGLIANLSERDAVPHQPRGSANA